MEIETLTEKIKGCTIEFNERYIHHHDKKTMKPIYRSMHRTGKVIGYTTNSAWSTVEIQTENGNSDLISILDITEYKFYKLVKELTIHESQELKIRISTRVIGGNLTYAVYKDGESLGENDKVDVTEIVDTAQWMKKN